MSRSFVCLLTLSAGLLVWIGCEDAPPAAPAVAPQSGTPPPPPASIEVGTPTPASGALPPPPGVTRSIADLPGATAAATAPGLPPANPAGPLQSLVNPGNVFFYDKDDVFLPKDPVDFLQRAVQNYMSERKYKADDSQDWPMLTDLSLLVQYKIIRALPAAPAGQKFVLDPQTRKVSLAPQ